MKRKLILLILLTGFFSLSYGQQNSKWDKWNWLTGEWKGEGSGKPGQGTGVFTFTSDLNREIIIRKSHTDFPAANGKPAFVHEDLLIVYSGPSGKEDKAIEKVTGTPVFRLVYTPVDNRTVNTSFEMPQDGETYSKYIEGKSIKTK